MLSNKQLWKGRSISAPRMRVQSLLGEGVWSEVAGSCCWKGVRLLAHMQADHEMEMEQQRVELDTPRLTFQRTSYLARPTPKVSTTF